MVGADEDDTQSIAAQATTVGAAGMQGITLQNTVLSVCEAETQSIAQPVAGVYAEGMMILLLLFLQKQSLAFAVYLFGIGTLLTGPGLKKNTCDNALTMTSPVHW